MAWQGEMIDMGIDWAIPNIFTNLRFIEAALKMLLDQYPTDTMYVQFIGRAIREGMV